MRWHPYVVVLLFLLCAVSVTAGSIVEVTVGDNKISIQEKATFSLTITNVGPQDAPSQRYSIHSVVSGIGWTIEPQPLRDRILEVQPQQTASTTIVVTPLEDFEPGVYTLPLSIRSDSGESYDQQLKIFITPDRPVEYAPAIRATIDMAEKIDLSQPLAISLFLENRNTLNLPGLTIRLQSEIPSFAQEVQVDLPSFGEKTVEFSIQPDTTQQPKEYHLFFVFEKDGQQVKVVEQVVEILPYTPSFTVDVTEEKMFLKRLKTITVRNPGNVRTTQLVRAPVRFWEALFIQPFGEQETMDGQRYLVWEATVSPGEKVTEFRTVNYRWPVYVLLAAVLLLLIYYALRSPITITKSVRGVERKEGTLTEMKVTLHVRNLTGKKWANITITDQLPAIAHIEKGLEVGTVTPSEVHQSAGGTKIQWKLLELDADEERLVTYKVKSKLNVVGTLKLPRATVEFARGKRKWKSYSNTFNVSS